MEIDARAGTFQAFDMFGQQLLQKDHYASDEVDEKLKDLAAAREALEQSVYYILIYATVPVLL